MSARQRLAATILRCAKRCREVRALASTEDCGLLFDIVEAMDRDQEKGGDEEAILVDYIISLLIAGHDTTSSSIAMATVLLQEHPEVWKKLVAEQLEISQHGPVITRGSLSKQMIYTEAVVREVWRYLRVIPGTGRRSLKAAQVSGYDLKGDQAMWIGLSSVLKDDPRWSSKASEDPLSPDRFNPDRFLSISGDLGSQQLVFGAGRHQCLGMHLALVEFKVFLAVLARGYNFNINSQGGPSGGHHERKMLSLFPFPVPDLSSATCKRL